MEHRFEDIQFLDGQIASYWKNFTAKEVGEQIRAFPKFTGLNQPKEQSVEYANIPSLIIPMVTYMKIHEKVPDTEELSVFYCYFFERDVKHLDFKALKGRLLRSYPATLRSYHFTLLCSECSIFQNVSYSLRRAIEEKVDIHLRYKEREVYLALLLDSPAVEKVLARREVNIKPEDSFIPVILKPEPAFQFGSYYLYTDFHIQYIKEELEKRENNTMKGVWF